MTKKKRAKTSPPSVLTVIADYSTTALGAWQATVAAENAAAGDVAHADGASLLACQDEVMKRVEDIANATGRFCQTLHLLNGDATAFITAYENATGEAA